MSETPAEELIRRLGRLAVQRHGPDYDYVAIGRITAYFRPTSVRVYLDDLPVLFTSESSEFPFLEPARILACLPLLRRAQVLEDMADV
jgi:hypothetical protein